MNLRLSFYRKLVTWEKKSVRKCQILFFIKNIMNFHQPIVSFYSIDKFKYLCWKCVKSVKIVEFCKDIISKIFGQNIGSELHKLTVYSPESPRLVVRQKCFKKWVIITTKVYQQATNLQRDVTLPDSRYWRRQSAAFLQRIQYGLQSTKSFLFQRPSSSISAYNHVRTFPRRGCCN